jgi:hypothetical protein
MEPSSRHGTGDTTTSPPVARIARIDCVAAPLTRSRANVPQSTPGRQPTRQPVSICSRFSGKLSTTATARSSRTADSDLSTPPLTPTLDDGNASSRRAKRFCWVSGATMRASPTLANLSRTFPALRSPYNCHFSMPCARSIRRPFRRQVRVHSARGPCRQRRPREAG